MPQDTPSRKLEQYIVRFPDGMRDRLKSEAAKNGRSLNAEIIARLALTLRINAPETVTPVDFSDLDKWAERESKLLELEDRIAEQSDKIQKALDLLSAEQQELREQKAFGLRSTKPV